jgi:hypothetical protein
MRESFIERSPKSGAPATLSPPSHDSRSPLIASPSVGRRGFLGALGGVTAAAASRAAVPATLAVPADVAAQNPLDCAETATSDAARAPHAVYSEHPPGDTSALDSDDGVWRDTIHIFLAASGD